MTEKNIRLVKVDTRNFDALIDLSVNDSQQEFVADNVYSLAEAYANLAEGRFAQPFGIYAGDDPVGFLMIGYDYQEWDEPTPPFVKNSYLIWRFMIDKAHQGKGYGRAAMRLALEYIRTFPCGKADCCWISYEPQNEAARSLYRSFGFTEMPEYYKGGDEMPAVLPL